MLIKRQLLSVCSCFGCGNMTQGCLTRGKIWADDFTSNPHKSSPSVNVLKKKKNLCVCKKTKNKSIIKIKISLDLTSNCCFQLKYKSSIHIIVFSSKKSDSGEKYAEMSHSLQEKTVLN